jgi:surface antigen
MRFPFRRLSGILVGALAAVSIGSPAHAATTITVKGKVTCAQGHSVVGVWIQSNGGGSKFASWTTISGASNQANYSASFSTATPTLVQLRVGCGGSRESWWGTNRTYNTKLSGSATRNATCNEAAGDAYRCTYVVSGANPFPSGQCTWGAAYKWFQFQGSYPNWGGDAKNWYANAKAKGWTVSSTPRTRAILVIQPGAWPLSSASEGHVGWVNGINKDSSGKIVSLNITDMNHKPGAWDTYDRPYKASGMSFVYAP